MGPEFDIRQLTSDDVPVLRSLNAVFSDAFEAADTYDANPPSDDYIRSLLAKDHVIVLVACVRGQVVGGIVAYDLDKFERARKETYIYDLAVAKPYRRRGIATALIERLRELAAARGSWVIFVQADRVDDAAIAVYEKLGVREEPLHFDIDVSAHAVPRAPRSPSARSRSGLR